MKCPKCNQALLMENINIQTDMAKCQSCSSIFKISENIDAIDTKFNIDEPPNGTWCIKNYDNTIIGATTRSVIAFFLVPFMLVWSGGSLGGIYGTQILSGEFNLFTSLFGIPFVLGSILFWGIALMAIFGKVELNLDKSGGKIFTGIGVVGFTKNFIWKDITSITEKNTSNEYRKGVTMEIILEGKSRLSFGGGLNDERRYYLLKALQNLKAQSR